MHGVNLTTHRLIDETRWKDRILLLLISYDLDTPQRPESYAKIKEAIEANALSFKRPLYSQWLVETNEDVDSWTTRLTPLLAQQDRMLIVRVQGRANGFLPSGNWPWINERAT
jgi:hypothetical protein